MIFLTNNILCAWAVNDSVSGHEMSIVGVVLECWVVLCCVFCVVVSGDGCGGGSIVRFADVFCLSDVSRLLGFIGVVVFVGAVVVAFILLPIFWVLCWGKGVVCGVYCLC